MTGILIVQTNSSFFEGWKAHDRLLVLDQKIPYRLIKITFLKDIETAIKSDIKYWVSIMGFSTSDAILDPCYLSFWIIFLNQG